MGWKRSLVIAVAIGVPHVGHIRGTQEACTWHTGGHAHSMHRVPYMMDAYFHRDFQKGIHLCGC